MPIVEFVQIKMKLFERLRSFHAVPSVGEQHTSDIPKNGANGSQSLSSPPAKSSGKSLNDSPQRQQRLLIQRQFDSLPEDDAIGRVVVIQPHIVQIRMVPDH